MTDRVSRTLEHGEGSGAKALRIERRLRKHGEFVRAQRSGRRVGTRHFTLLVAAQPPPPRPARLGLVVARRVGSAVRRNRVKRLCRECFRALPELLPQGVDLVVIAREGAPELALAGEPSPRCLRNEPPRRWRGAHIQIILPPTSAPQHRNDVEAASMLARLLIALVRVYRRFLSPALNAFGPLCRFEPSCSRYALACLQEHGAVRGSVLSIVRICKCNPFHPGGFDPPPVGPARTGDAEGRRLLAPARSMSSLQASQSELPAQRTSIPSRVG